jgi:hypothetical protein
VLAFTHPFTGNQHRFEVPEPDAFEKIVKKGSRAPGEPHAQSPKVPSSGKGRSVDGRSRGTASDTDEGKKVPRRQRGKPASADARQNGRAQKYPRDETGGKERNIEDLTDLKALPRKSRTKQVTGKSRFIPGK